MPSHEMPSHEMPSREIPPQETLSDESTSLAGDAVAPLPTPPSYFVFTTDADGHVMSWNANAALMTGFAASEVVGASGDCLYTAADLARQWSSRARANASRDGMFSEQLTLVRANGSQFPVTAVVTAQCNAAGEPCGYAWVIRAGAANTPRDPAFSLAHLHAVMQSVTDGTMIIDRTGAVVEVSAAFLRMFGAPDGQLDADQAKQRFNEIQVLTADGLPLEPQQRPQARVLRGETLRSVELGIAHPRTSRIWWLRVSGGPVMREDGDFEFAVLAIEDIAEQHKAALGLARTRQLFAAMVETTPDSVYAKDAEGRFLFVNPALVKLARIGDEGRFIGKTDFDVLPAALAAQFKQQDDAVLQSGTAAHFERVMPAAPGAVPITMHIAKFAFRDERGRVAGTIGVARDISERKQAEQAIAASDARWRELADAIPQTVFEANTQGEIVYANRYSYARRGAPAGAPGDWRSALHPQDLAGLAAHWRAALASGEPLQYEARVRIADGSYHWTAIHAVAVRDAAGVVTRWYGSAADIHELKMTQEALAEREERLRLAIAATQLGVWEWRASTQAFFWSEECQKIVGAAVLGTTTASLTALVYPSDVGRVLRDWHQSMQDQAAFTANFRVVRGDGELRSVAMRGVSESDATGVFVRMLGTLQDVTDAQTTEQLRAIQGEVNRVIANAATMQQLTRGTLEALCSATGFPFAALWEIDTVTDELRCSDLYNAAGSALQALTDATWLMRMKRGVGGPGEVWKTGRSQWSVDPKGSLDLQRYPRARLIVKLGLGAHFALPIVIDGVVAGVIDFLSWDSAQPPITLLDHLNYVGNQIGQAMKRKRAEDEVKRFVEGSQVAVYAIDVRKGGSRRRWFSENTRELLGLPPDTVDIATWWLAHVHSDDRARVLEAISFAPGQDHDVLEYRFARASGDTIWLRDERRLHRDEARVPTEIIGSLINVTERVRLEEELRQAHKMEAVGQLAGGIAHDFNNLLTVISGYSELLLKALPPQDRMHAYVTSIRESSVRASGLTQQLLAYSRKQMLAPQILDLNDIVRGIEKLLLRMISEDILFSTSFAPLEHRVKVDRGQLEQVLMNLVVNARDAMPMGGNLRIETCDVSLSAAWCRTRPGAQPGKYVQLSVIDSGEGMAPAVLARIFEPFFTTKAKGKGTGLGLCTVFGIVNQSGGHIAVDSTEGHGARFDIYLPAIDALAEASVSTPEGADHVAELNAAPAPRHGNERVLLVEDESGVRKIAREALEALGYEVVEAADGDAAYAIFNANTANSSAARFDLLVTDVVMPGMSGVELARLLAGADYQIKVLFMSGYTDDAIIRHGLQQARVTFLHKPFALSALGSKVREVLDAGASPCR